MIFLCIMGRSGSGKSLVESKLEQIGFKRNISYTTREPQIRDGVLEESGREYVFVSREKFMSLVDKGNIIEYEEYNGNLYGTPRPFGSTRYVSVVCVNGYKKLKEIYGDQVIGIYIKVDKDVAKNRGSARNNNTNIIEIRDKLDDKLVIEMEAESDIVIDGNKHINRVLADILKLIRQ